jgi:hypothetical protein
VLFAVLVIIIHMALPFYCARMWLRSARRPEPTRLSWPKQREHEQHHGDDARSDYG